MKMEKNNENVIEFLTGEKMVTVSFTNRKHVNKVKKLFQECEEEFGYLYENEDGSICARIPLSWIKINHSRNVRKELTPEQKEKRIEALRKAREAKK